jgi:hypothetical protein
MTIQRLFIANRGEIALRVLRTAHKMGIETVLGVSEADAASLPARLAGRAVVLAPALRRRAIWPSTEWSPPRTKRTAMPCIPAMASCQKMPPSPAP